MNKKYKLKELIAFIGSSSLLSIGSCTHEGVIPSSPESDFSSKNFASDCDSYSSPFQLSSYVSSTEQVFVKKFAQLSRDMYLNPNLAAEFKAHSDSVFEEYGFKTAPFTPESSQGLCLISLSDVTAMSYLEEGEFMEFINYLNENGATLDKNNILYPYLRGASSTSSSSQNAEFFPILAIPVAIYAVAATIVAVEVAVVAHFAVKVGFAGVTRTTGSNMINRRKEFDSTKSLIRTAVDPLYSIDQLNEEEVNRLTDEIISQIDRTSNT